MNSENTPTKKQDYTCITTSKLIKMLDGVISNYYVKYFKLVLSDGTTIELDNDTNSLVGHKSLICLKSFVPETPEL